MKSSMSSRIGVAVAALALAVSPAAWAHGAHGHEAPAGAKGQRIEIAVTEAGFTPTPLKVFKGVPVTVVVTRKTEKTCVKEIVVKELHVKKELPLNTPVEFTFTPTKTGDITYACGLNMLTGTIAVE